MGKRKNSHKPKTLEDPDVDEFFNLHLLDCFAVPSGMPSGHNSFSSLSRGLGWGHMPYIQSYPAHYYFSWQLEGTPSLFRLSTLHPFRSFGGSGG